MCFIQEQFPNFDTLLICAYNAPSVFELIIKYQIIKGFIL